MLIQRRLRWLGRSHRFFTEFPYGELRDCARQAGRPLLRFKDTIKCDLKAAYINATSWEDILADRDTWRHSVKGGASRVEEDGRVQTMCWRERRESSRRPPHAPYLPMSAQTAWGTVTPGSGFTATRDPAPPAPCANHRFFETRIPTTMKLILHWRI